MGNDWDKILKMLVHADPQAFVTLIAQGAHFQHDITNELIARSVRADFLCKALRHNEDVVIHAEFQRYHDSNMNRRMWEYNSITTFLTGFPVCSFALYLRKDNSIVRSPYRQKLVDGKLIHSFHYDKICLWEITPAKLKKAGLESLLPLLPLTKGAEETRDEIVDDMINGLMAAGKEDLLALGYIIAGQVYDTYTDLQWLRRRFKVVYELFKDSWAYQEITKNSFEEGRLEGEQKGEQKGKLEGKLEGERRSLVRIVATRFPQLASRAQEQADRLTTLELLDTFTDKLLLVHTAEQVQEILAEIEQLAM